MVIAEVSVVPIGTGSPSVSDYVAQCHRILAEEEGLKYLLTPMGTIIEGELPQILEVIQKLHQVPFKMGALRVVTDLKIDERKDKELSMEGKIQAVETKLAG